MLVEVGPVGPAAGDAGKAFPPQLAQPGQQGQSRQQGPRLAEEIAHGPGGLPAVGLGDAVQRGLQLLLVLVGGRQLAALMVGQLLVVAAALLGAVQLEAQRVQGVLVVLHQGAVRLRLRRAEQGRAVQRAPALPGKVPAQARRLQSAGPRRQDRSRFRLPCREQHPLRGQSLRAGGVLPLHHHQVIPAGPAGGQRPACGQPALPRLLRAQAPGVDLAVPQRLRQAAVPHHQDPAGPELRLDDAGELPLASGPFLLLQILCALHILAPILNVQSS